MLKKFLISPPFGSYIQRDWATSVVGSFTLEKRPGLIKQTIKTLRPIKGGWVNNIGFRNKGIKNVKFDNMGNESGRLISVAGIGGDNDWREMADQIPNEYMVEVNVGCPNIGSYSITRPILLEFVNKFPLVSLKVPPTQEAMTMVLGFYWHSGLRYVHISNTIPTERGGESGKRLKELNIPFVKHMKLILPNINVIGGGGIYSPQDVIDYKNAGADYFSLATVWFTPWRMKKIVAAAK